MLFRSGQECSSLPVGIFFGVGVVMRGRVMSEGRILDQWRNMYQSRRAVGGGDGKKGENVKDSGGMRLGMK